MAERDLEVDVYEFLQRIQLEQFFERLDKVLHLTRLSHFDHVAESDLNDINMSKPEQRRLFDAIKKHKKERKKVGKLRFSLRKSKKKESSFPSGESGVKHGQAKSCLISESSLKLLGVLGDGAFGVVSKGEWTPNKGSKLSVAVKCLKFSDRDAFVKEQDNFMREARAMSELDHPNVIHLYGIVLATPIKLVMELASLGSLKDRLRSEPQKFLVATLYDFVSQIASGMSYLESKRCVHRDLAARNILLASYDKVKIGDFGLMRLLPSEDEIYVMNPLGKVAVAWCAPECLKNREFSHASDVWAFGITVIEIFSYGKQPWDGLSGVQILDIIDEPANGRPGKPDCCPDKLYSLLFEHCWDPNPKDRSRFSSIQAKLQEGIPPDVTLFFDLENDTNPDSLVGKSGDLVTVITWKSRLGTEFAKGQNKRTAEVGYFPISQVLRHNLKSKSSAQRRRITKVKDISPPLDNSFSHIAHRGHGEMPDWGTIMSEERKVLGKYRPLNLPSKLISLNGSDSESQIEGFGGEMDSWSLMSRDSCSSLSFAHRSCADSGYYSNRDTFVSQEYEQMTGSNPIAIPNSYVRSKMPTGASSSFMPAQHFPFRPPGAGIQFDQQCRGDSLGSDSAKPQQCPAPPTKLEVIGDDGNIKSTIVFPCNKEKPENPYENLTEVQKSNYELMQRPSSLTHRVIEEPSMSSSPESVYENNKETKSAESLGFINMNYPIIYDRPTIDYPFNCSENGRCYSFPEFDMKRKFGNKWQLKRNSFSSEKQISLHSLNESKSAPILDREVETMPNSKNWETRTADEAMSEDIYENIEIYNVPQAIMSDIPPPLPLKRRYSQRRRGSVNRNSGSHDLGSSKKMALSAETLEEHYSRPVSQDVTPNFDSHLYAEISDQLVKQLNLDDQNELYVNTNFEETNEESSFKEISKDYADLDEICAKLQESTTVDKPIAENANEATDKPSPLVSREKTRKANDVLWRRLSTDQHRILQFTRRDNKRSSCRRHDRPKNSHLIKRRLSDSSNHSSSSSLKHPCAETEGVQSLQTRATLVTTV